jgi:NADPH:quinone reductase-like Zn-dependent oxidoreductase
MAAAWAGDAGFQVILDPVGGAYLEQDQAVLGIGGRIVVIGLLGGRRAEVDLVRLLMRHQHIVGTTLRSRPDALKADILAGVRAVLWPLVTAGEVRPQVYASFPVARANEALALLASDATFGKVVLTVP